MDQTSPHGLKELEVAITGRLASMSRERAVEAIKLAGGRYVEAASESTDLLVIGGDGPPLAKDGRPTKNLRAAHELQSRGIDLRIIPEEDFVRRLGNPEWRAELSRLYTTAQLSRILEVPVARIRGWMRHGLITPVQVVRRLCYFEFRQVASAKRLLTLTESGVSLGQIRRSLEQLEGWTPDIAPDLERLQALENGGPILVRLDDGRLAEPSGQLHFDFWSPRHPGDRVREEDDSTPSLSPRQQSADDWFHIGVTAESAGHYESAVEAYQNALSLGDPQPEVCFNLGNTYYAMDRNVEAAACFIQATELDPNYVEAWNNLGNALSEIGRHGQAIPAYERALSIEPTYADAHYNLGETLAMVDDLTGAREHWLAYLRQDPNSPWAMRVRQRLSEN